ncbi:HAD family hydrolase [Haloglycomyces albus]|uniref:HAD family hydrolase n=1 Tax=Haloglycomyces albus TaxID=526067 RepID=UPI00046D0EE9|nr:HAD family hydrolase [Haloglycomyces albus]
MVPRSAAFFDLDKTIVSKSSALAFGRPLYHLGLLGRRDVLRAAYGQLVYRIGGGDGRQMERTRNYLADLSRGWSAETVRDVVMETLDHLIQPFIYTEALDLVRGHLDAGRNVVLISASGYDIVSPIADSLGIPEVIATRLRTDGNGMYTGEVEFYAAGQAKAEAIRDYARNRDIDLSASFAYSDSITDEPMLRAVGNPRVVNGDKSLRKLGKSEGWPLLSFNDPTREGKPCGKEMRTGFVAVAALAVVGFWAWRRWLR